MYSIVSKIKILKIPLTIILPLQRYKSYWSPFFSNVQFDMLLIFKSVIKHTQQNLPSKFLPITTTDTVVTTDQIQRVHDKRDFSSLIKQPLLQGSWPRNDPL